MMDDEGGMARKPKRETVMNMFNNGGEESRNKILDGNLNFDSYNSFVPEQKPTFKLGLFKHGGENGGNNNEHFSADMKAFSAVDNSHSTSQVHNPIYLTTNARNLLEEIINGSGDLDTPQQIPVQPEQQMDGSERKQRILEQMRNAEFNMMEGNYFSL